MNTHEGCTLARAAVNDGVAAKDVSKMASCGTGGKHAGNEMRDFRRLYGRTHGLGS